MWSQFFHCLADMHHSFILLQIFRFNITLGQFGIDLYILFMYILMSQEVNACCERKYIDKI